MSANLITEGSASKQLSDIISQIDGNTLIFSSPKQIEFLIDLKNKIEPEEINKIRWLAIVSYINKFSTGNKKFKEIMVKQAREWFAIKFLKRVGGF